MIVAPEQAQRRWFQHVHVVRPGQFDLPDPIAQIVRIGHHHLVDGSVLKAGRTLRREVQTSDGAPLGEDSGRQVTLDPLFRCFRFGKLDREPVVAFWKEMDGERWTEI